MPSLPVRIVSFVLGTTGIVRRRYSAGNNFLTPIRAAQALPRSQPDAKMRRLFAVEAAEFEGNAVWTMAPRGCAPSANILFWHGGGYVYPITALHWKFLAHMVGKHGWAVTVPYYPLSPESDAQTTTGWALAFYRHYTEALNGEAFIMAGDSAGGGLAAATAMSARDAGLRLPEKIILICPWLALDPKHPDQPGIEPREVILTMGGIQEAGKLYAGTLPAADPRCSPINGSWEELPPIQAFGGGDDILVTDARQLKAKLPSLEYTELAGMMHDWPIFSFSESRAAQAQMAAFAARAIP